ncbi:hypothetical protein HYFRA_00009484 [Hymenoscyphus fraxineus]|uniref:Uncharacterized protein n=1 Tax=Hymenoscyphus fraxineus TaxID=746836 RepID=A0A9N9L0K9_9HELO|nr:hypothetical protein HYFRA_00009484 [Hymenoscyphus fraxineus]
MSELVKQEALQAGQGTTPVFLAMMEDLGCDRDNQLHLDDGRGGRQPQFHGSLPLYRQPQPVDHENLSRIRAWNGKSSKTFFQNLDLGPVDAIDEGKEDIFGGQLHRQNKAARLQQTVNQDSTPPRGQPSPRGGHGGRGGRSARGGLDRQKSRYIKDASKRVDNLKDTLGQPASTRGSHSAASSRPAQTGNRVREVREVPRLPPPKLWTTEEIFAARRRPNTIANQPSVAFSSSRPAAPDSPETGPSSVVTQQGPSTAQEAPVAEQDAPVTAQYATEELASSVAETQPEELSQQVSAPSLFKSPKKPPGGLETSMYVTKEFLEWYASKMKAKSLAIQALAASPGALANEAPEPVLSPEANTAKPIPNLPKVEQSRQRVMGWKDLEWCFDDGAFRRGNLIISSKDSNSPREYKVEDILPDNTTVTVFDQVLPRDLDITRRKLLLFSIGPLAGEHKYLRLKLRTVELAIALDQIILTDKHRPATSVLQTETQIVSCGHSSTAEIPTEVATGALSKDAEDFLEHFSHAGVAHIFAGGLEALYKQNALQHLFDNFNQSSLHVQSPKAAILANEELVAGAQKMLQDYVQSAPTFFLYAPEGVTGPPLAFGKQVLEQMLISRDVLKSREVNAATARTMATTTLSKFENSTVEAPKPATKPVTNENETIEEDVPRLLDLRFRPAGLMKQLGLDAISRKPHNWAMKSSNPMVKPDLDAIPPKPHESAIKSSGPIVKPDPDKVVSNQSGNNTGIEKSSSQVSKPQGPLKPTGGLSTSKYAENLNTSKYAGDLGVSKYAGNLNTSKYAGNSNVSPSNGSSQPSGLFSTTSSAPVKRRRKKAPEKKYKDWVQAERLGMGWLVSSSEDESDAANNDEVDQVAPSSPGTLRKLSRDRSSLRVSPPTPERVMRGNSTITRPQPMGPSSANTNIRSGSTQTELGGSMDVARELQYEFNKKGKKSPFKTKDFPARR